MATRCHYHTLNFDERGLITLAYAQIRSLVLLNLGGMVDLLYYFAYLPATCIIHVIDSHRPTNLANLYTPSSYASALFDPRNGAMKRRWNDAGLPPPELSVIVWADAEDDEEARDVEKEAFLALLVRCFRSSL